MRKTLYFCIMEEKEFEKCWLQNRERLLANDAEWQQMRDSYKTHSGSDMLLYAIPIVVGIVCLDYLPIKHELLLWGVSAVIMIVVSVICVQIKSAASGIKSAGDIEKRVKEEYRRQLEKR